MRCFSLESINVTAMTDANRQNDHFLILNYCKDSIGADAIAPLTRQTARKWFSFGTRVVAIQNMFLAILYHSLLNGFFKFFEVFQRFGRKFQLPLGWQILSQVQVPSLRAQKGWFAYQTLSILYRLAPPIRFLLALPRIWLTLFLHSRLWHDWYGKQEHQVWHLSPWIVGWKTWSSFLFLTICSKCSTYCQKVKIFAVFLLTATLSGTMSEGHRVGSAAASSLLGGVQQTATNTSPNMVPGFVTDNPKEASLDHGSIGGATSAELRSNEAAVAISENARTRQKFVIDPTTDPLFINAHQATANPEQTMQEMTIETSDGTGDQDDMVECIEGGEEYIQTCRKQLVLKIQITPGKRRCDCALFHWFPTHGHRHHVNGNAGGGWAFEYVTPRKVEILSEEWTDGCAALEAQSDEGLCRYEEEIVGPQETRSIQGPVVGSSAFDSEPIKRDAWEKTYTYKCLKKIEGTCDALRAKGCIDDSSVCIEEIAGVCVAWKKTLRCPSTKKRTRKYRMVGEKSPFCLTGDCADSDYEANGEMLDAMTQLAVLKEVQNDIRANLGIFKGQARQCRKNCLGFRDCCTTGKGWGISLNLAECSGEERELADWRDKKKCMLVGTYCSEREPITKICIRKKSSFCCFGTKLARLINSQGRRQLGIGFGDAEAPNCRGLTPDELSRLDMSRMNLSELYEDVQDNFKPRSQAHIAQGMELDRIRENMSRMTRKVSVSDSAVATVNTSVVNIPRNEH